MSSVLAALRFAIGLLTAIPVGAVPTPDRRQVGRALVLAPLTTLPVLIIVLLGGAVVGAGVTSWLVAVLVIIAGVLFSRAMHLDGLADTADGLSAGFDRERSLRAMKASDVGPSGVVVLVLVLLLQVTALQALLTGPGWAVAVAALGWPASRLGLAWACRTGVPAATDSGLGALVAGSVRPVGAALGPVTVAVVGVVVIAAVGGPWWAVLIIVAAVIALTAVVVGIARRRLGGITGDVLGAIVELSLAGWWVVAAATLGLLGS